MAVTVQAGQDIIFGGTGDPCAFASLKSIGCLGVDENKSHSEKISKHVEEKLGIKKDRFVTDILGPKLMLQLTVLQIL